MDNGDVRLQLDDLEAEEARIMRELREMDEKAEAEKVASSRRADQIRDDPEAALSALLLECEKEVRDAKGYIADQGPPLKIVRLKHGETGPRSATYLSRPRNTGVDFTVPVTLKAYTELIKNPIFLNQIREKIKSRKYRSSEDYVEDMRLLVRNTAQFNKGPDLAWVVQHAKFLLESAEDAVHSRRLAFHQIEQQLQQQVPSKPSRSTQGALSAVGKRKRTQNTEKTNGDVVTIPPVGSSIEIYWHPYRKWYVAYITEREGSSVHVRYQEDNSEQVVDLNRERWRMRTSRAATRSKRGPEPATKRRKGSAVTPTTQAESAALPTSAPTHEALDSIKIDLFTKFEDLRDSVNEQLKQHLDRVDSAILRSDALTRILVQLGDTQTSVETAVTKVFDRFEELERRFESVLQSQEHIRMQGETREEKRVKSTEDQDVQVTRNSDRPPLENKEKIEDTKHDGGPANAEEGPSAQDASKPDPTDKEHADAADTSTKEISKKIKDNTTPILVTDDEDPKLLDKASPDKANVSPDGKISSPKNDDGVVDQDRTLPKKQELAGTKPNRDRMSESDQEDVMDVDGEPKSEERPQTSKGEKSPLVLASRKVVSGDTGKSDTPTKTFTDDESQKAKPDEGSDEGRSSGSSSGSEESEESESEKDDTADADINADTKSETVLKEPRKPKTSRFANRTDTEKSVDKGESPKPKGNGKNESELPLSHGNGVSESNVPSKGKVEHLNAVEEEGSTNAVQGPKLRKDDETMKSGAT
ncbi:unnamed protein product [Agarophyton chilense]